MVFWAGQQKISQFEKQLIDRNPYSHSQHRVWGNKFALPARFTPTHLDFLITDAHKFAVSAHTYSFQEWWLPDSQRWWTHRGYIFHITSCHMNIFSFSINYTPLSVFLCIFSHICHIPGAQASTGEGLEGEGWQWCLW